MNAVIRSPGRRDRRVRGRAPLLTPCPGLLRGRPLRSCLGCLRPQPSRSRGLHRPPSIPTSTSSPCPSPTTPTQTIPRGTRPQHVGGPECHWKRPQWTVGDGSRGGPGATRAQCGRCSLTIDAPLPPHAPPPPRTKQHRHVRRHPNTVHSVCRPQVTYTPPPPQMMS